jgi:hypothetical protein
VRLVYAGVNSGLQRIVDWLIGRAYYAAMKSEDAIGYFGGVSKLADLLGLSRQAVYQWGDHVPLHWQYHLERLSAGKLQPDLPLPNYALPPHGDAA